MAKPTLKVTSEKAAAKAAAAPVMRLDLDDYQAAQRMADDLDQAVHLWVKPGAVHLQPEGTPEPDGDDWQHDGTYWPLYMQVD